MISKVQLFALLMPAILFMYSCGKANQTNNKAPVVAPEGFSLSEARLFQVKAVWAEPLKSGGDGTNEVTLSFLTTAGEVPESVSLLEFHPRMPLMGNHGTDEDTQAFAPGTEPATVEVSGIYFNMPGGVAEWVVTVKATVNGVTDEIKIPAPEVF